MIRFFSARTLVHGIFGAISASIGIFAIWKLPCYEFADLWKSHFDGFPFNDSEANRPMAIELTIALTLAALLLFAPRPFRILSVMACLWAAWVFDAALKPAYQPLLEMRKQAENGDEFAKKLAETAWNGTTLHTGFWAIVCGIVLLAIIGLVSLFLRSHPTPIDQPTRPPSQSH